jgi:hypothetical protein
MNQPAIRIVCKARELPGELELASEAMSRVLVDGLAKCLANELGVVRGLVRDGNTKAAKVRFLKALHDTEASLMNLGVGS